jgi:hypothetical protein
MRNIFLPIAQRRKVQLQPLETIVEIPAKTTIGHPPLQIAIGRCHDAHIHRSLPIVPQPMLINVNFQVADIRQPASSPLTLTHVLLNDGDVQIQAQAGDLITFTYSDALATDGTGPNPRTDQTDVVGGTDGTIEVSIASQPGDPVYIKVVDADISTPPLDYVPAATTIDVDVTSSTTDQLTVTLDETAAGSGIFVGSLGTTSGTEAGKMTTAEEDVLTVTYIDDLGTMGEPPTDRTDDNEVLDPWGDADDNDQLQAFDAALTLLEVIDANTLNGLPELAANVDIDPVGTGINPFDVSVWADDRSEILSGDLRIEGIIGRVEMGAELSNFLSASRATEEGLRVVFAGVEATSGPGELLRIYTGVGPGRIQLTRTTLNGGNMVARIEDSTPATSSPSAFALHPNHPNPFNPETTIRYDVPEAGMVSLQVYDVTGQLVRELVGDFQMAGSYSVVWDGRNTSGESVATGLYLYKLQAGALRAIHKMMLAK